MSPVDSGSDYGSVLSAAQHGVQAPRPFKKETATTAGARTAWDTEKGAPLSAQTAGSTMTFEDKSSTPLPESDRGVSFA